MAQTVFWNENYFKINVTKEWLFFPNTYTLEMTHPKDIIDEILANVETSIRRDKHVLQKVKNEFKGYEEMFPGEYKLLVEKQDYVQSYMSNMKGAEMLKNLRDSITR